MSGGAASSAGAGAGAGADAGAGAGADADAGAGAGAGTGAASGATADSTPAAGAGNVCVLPQETTTAKGSAASVASERRSRSTAASLTPVFARASARVSRYSASVIRVSHLTKRYGAYLAVDDVSFEIGRGEVVGFLGPNGAGKSTTLRILAGFLDPTDGEVSVAGHDVVRDSIEARRAIGYMPESVPLYPEMRVVEYLAFRAELKRVPRRVRRAAVDGAIGKTGIAEVAHRRIAHLSRGYRQRVGLADAIVADPPIVILDEPTAGLDPNQIREARALIRELGREHTVVVSTHILSEVEACATRVLLIHRGRLVAGGPTESIRALRHSAAVDVIVRGDVGLAEITLAAVPGVLRVERGGEAGDVARLRVTYGERTAPADAARTTERSVAALVTAGLGVREVAPAGGSLESVFAALTAAPAQDGAESSDAGGGAG
jgi:ABC-2 type transport system ATP-binding protein